MILKVAYNKQYLQQKFAIFNDQLVDEIWAKSNTIELDEGQQIIKIGQYVKVIPIVLVGIVKVYTYRDDKEFLLYYIKENESCIMSYSASVNNDTSQVYAVTESKALLLLMPVSDVIQWSKKYPEFNSFYLKFYQSRYLDLVETLRHVVFDHLDNRIILYLKQKVELSGHQFLKITHKEIASDLATTREVVSRILKKLKADEKLKFIDGLIEVI